MCTIIKEEEGEEEGEEEEEEEEEGEGNTLKLHPHLCHTSEGSGSIRSSTRTIPQLPGSSPRTRWQQNKRVRFMLFRRQHN